MSGNARQVLAAVSFICIGMVLPASAQETVRIRGTVDASMARGMGSETRRRGTEADIDRQSAVRRDRPGQDGRHQTGYVRRPRPA